MIHSNWCIEANGNSTSNSLSLFGGSQTSASIDNGLIFGFLSASKAEIYATAGGWKSEMHVSKLDGSWNETSDDLKFNFQDTSDIFSNRMMPGENIAAASDLDLKMAITVRSQWKLRYKWGHII